jgi:hypothetical protein
METIRRDGSGWAWTAKCGTSGSGTSRDDAVNRLRLHKNTCPQCKR